MTSTLQADELREVKSSDDLIHPGDFYLRNVPLYNSSKSIFSIVMKCPFCGMDMMSTGDHRIRVSKIRWLYRIFGLGHGITIRPRLECPFNKHHSFLISKGKIVAVKK